MSPRICYEDWNPQRATRERLDRIHRVLETYEEPLTVRQLFYQFVARDWIENTQSSYGQVARTVKKGRRAGLIDWDAITDRSRSRRSRSRYASPDDALRQLAKRYAEDRWREQPVRMEVWYEKAALAGVFGSVCRELDVPHLAAVGSPSDSKVWRAARRFRGWVLDRGQEIVLLHFTDHDPTGVDMTRDLRERLHLFLSPHGTPDTGWEVRRMALTMEQIEEFAPPPNPAKVTDPRFDSYRSRFGEESWELDALDPHTLTSLVRDEVVAIRDEEIWQESLCREEEARERLRELTKLTD